MVPTIPWHTIDVRSAAVRQSCRAYTCPAQCLTALPGFVEVIALDMGSTRRRLARWRDEVNVAPISRRRTNDHFFLAGAAGAPFTTFASTALLAEPIALELAADPDPALAEPEPALPVGTPAASTSAASAGTTALPDPEPEPEPAAGEPDPDPLPEGADFLHAPRAPMIAIVMMIFLMAL